MEGSRKAPKLEFLPSFEKEIEQKQRISVDSQKLDQLMHLVTELVTTQSQFSLAMHTEDLHTLNDVMGRMQKLTKQFRDITIDIRLVPLSELAVVFKRLVRDLSKQLSKKVNFVTEGVDTELDKSTLQLLTEPLMHIIRNCIDHGINTPEMRQSKGKAPEGTITFKAWQLGNDIFIKISDDGEGLDLERIAEKAIAQKLISANTKLTHELAAELIFHPGFSTAESITEVSGRGVGMDVVRRKLQEIRGQVVVQSQTGVGSSFTLKLQQSIAILDTMLVRVAGIHCLIPLTDIEVCGQTNYPELLENKYLHTIEFGGEAIPYVILRDKLQLLDNLPTKAKVVYLSVEAKRIGLVVDQIIGEHQAVLKPLGKEFETIQYINSASTLGDGSLAYLLNITQLFAGYRSKLD
jgi:two-component system chemotaxis sensor kinase CheA